MKNIGSTKKIRFTVEIDVTQLPDLRLTFDKESKRISEDIYE